LPSGIIEAKNRRRITHDERPAVNAKGTVRPSAKPRTISLVRSLKQTRRDVCTVGGRPVVDVAAIIAAWFLEEVSGCGKGIIEAKEEKISV